MITLNVPRLSIGKYQVWGLTVSTSSEYVNCVLFEDDIPSNEFEYRLPCEFLKQGKAFDTYGNRSVSNLQTKGMVCKPPTINGVKCLPTKAATWRSGYQYRTYHSMPPTGVTPSGSPAVLPQFGRLQMTSVYAWSQSWGFALQSQRLENGRVVTAVCRVAYSAFTSGSSRSGVIANLYLGSGSVPIPSGIKADWVARAREVVLIRNLSDRTYYDDYAKKALVFANEIVDTILSSASDWTSGYQPTKTTGLTISSIRQPTLSQEEFAALFPITGYELLNSPLLRFSDDDLSNLAGDVVEAYNDFSSNMLAYVSDLGSVGSTIKEVTKLGKNWKNPAAWAKAWLSGRYGDALFVADTKELFSSVQKRFTTRLSETLARARTSKVVAHKGVDVQLKRTATIVAYNDSFNDVMTSVNNLMRWDLWPTLENTWDLVPLSFVVDWVIPVQDILTQIDDCVQAPYIKTKTAYYGQSKSYKVSVVSDDLVADVSLSLYERRKSNVLGDIRPFSTEITFLPSFSVTHMGDAVALAYTARHR